MVTELCLYSQTGVRMIATEQDSEHSILDTGKTTLVKLMGCQLSADIIVQLHVQYTNSKCQIFN